MIKGLIKGTVLAYVGVFVILCVIIASVLVGPLLTSFGPALKASDATFFDLVNSKPGDVVYDTFKSHYTDIVNDKIENDSWTSKLMKQSLERQSQELKDTLNDMRTHPPMPTMEEQMKMIEEQSVYQKMASQIFQEQQEQIESMLEENDNGN